MVLGKITVAGNESYGADKQQQTLTVEVLWIRGIKKLCPPFPLLVKGRNLYKLRTFRQRWSKEAERSKVLAEKHRRGEAARRVRAMKKSRKLTENRGVKCQKKSRSTRPNQIRKNNESEKGKHFDRLQRTSRSSGSAKHNSLSQHQAGLPSKQMTSKASLCFRRHQKSARPNIDRDPALHSQAVLPIPHQSLLELQHRSSPFRSLGHVKGSISTMLRYPVITHFDAFIEPASQFHRFYNSNYRFHGYIHNLENWNHLSGVNVGRPFRLYISGAENRGNGGIKFSPFYSRMLLLKICMLPYLFLLCN